MIARDPAHYRLCLVTDDALAGERALTTIVGQAIEGGVTMVQLRAKTQPTRAFVSAAQALRGLLRDRAIPLIVNDRVDIALAAGADGIHVGQDDMPVPIVRRLAGPDMLIGLSITSDAEMAGADAAQADYLGVGPLFQQTTKADAAPALGLDGLARLRRATRQPILAIGGIGPGNAAAVMQAGADGLAVVSAIMGSADPAAAARTLRALVGASTAVRRG